MSTSRRAQFSVGLLVLIAAGLVVAFVVFLTRERVGQRDAMFETYIRESVSGLDVGSTVRYRGVVVGRVVHIGLAAADYRPPAGVPFESAFQLVVVRFTVNLDLVGEFRIVEEAVRQGLRARVATQGITGVSNIELDFADPARTVITRVPWTPRNPWIPAIPSTVAQIQLAFENVVRQFQNVDVSEIAGNVNTLLARLSHIAQDADMAGTVAEATTLLRELRAALAGADLPGVAAELRATGAATRGVLEGEELQATIRALALTAQEMRATVQRLPAVLTQVEGVLRAARGTTTDFQAEMVPLMRELRSVAANLRDTTEALRRSPSQALLGAPPPPGPGR
ncbi:MAG: MlaD family protein [Rubritepida sp.]|jgi:ABC-type transporter Mla subunit MlaD|nr:MlaD family protein [Rubritepida sp.]MCU0943863.1 MlaD family protein [Rubritepida sp.]